MQDLLDTIYHNRKSGLYFINTPTGSAKSYSSVQLMKTYCDSIEGRFIFITNNLNNLPMEDLKKALGKDYSKYVLRIESVVDNISHTFDERIIPEEFKCMNSYKKLCSCLDTYNDQKDMIESMIKDHRGIPSGMMKIFVQIKEDLQEADTSFRKEIREELMKRGLKKINLEERKKIIKSQYKWIGILYPAIFAEDYKIICMSVKKFFVSNDTIYKHNYHFYNSDLVTNSILFIDEVDATKSEINNIILDRCLKSMVDLIPMVNRIVEKFIHWEDTMPKTLLSLVSEENKLFTRVRNEATFIRNNYHDEFPYFCSTIKSRNFLMSDATFHASFEDQSKRNAYVYHDIKDNQMTIDIKQNRGQVVNATKDVYSLFTVIRDMMQFLMITKIFFNNLGISYMELMNSNINEHEDLMSEYDALNSIYKVFRLTDSDIKYFNEVNTYSTNAVETLNDRLKKSNNYYDRGIRTFEFTNTKQDSFNTFFNYIYLSHSAENVLVDLAKRCTVIGLSATCNIESVLSNYSLRYLKQQLQTNLHFLDGDDYQRIQEEYSLLNRKYDTNEIEVIVQEVDEKFHDVNSMALEDMVCEVYHERIIQKTVLRIFERNSIQDKHHIKRYLVMALVYKYFLSHDDMKSFLCLNNALPQDKGNFDYNILKKLFSNVHSELEISEDVVSVEILKSGVSFEHDKMAILKRLTDGERIFVISSYATIGAGQNMAYEIKDFSNTVNLTDFKNEQDGRNFKKDFDGIYLGPITHAVSNLYDTTADFNENELLHFLIELENLYENDEINHVELEQQIRAAFQKIKYPHEKCHVPSLKGCRSVQLFKSKQVIQAVGRLSRSFNKNKKVHILINEDIINNFDTSLLEREILSPEIVQLVYYIKDRQIQVPVYDYVENQASRISNEGKFYIFELLSGYWTEEKIALYKKLGELCLKYPTASQQVYHDELIVQEYYIQAETKKNKYYFTEVRDFEYTDIFFNERKEEVELRIRNNGNLHQMDYIREVSEENARLDVILKYPGLKELFDEREYATTFDKNAYILSPVLYQNIYKGRLGEVVGKFVLEKELNIQLEELDTSEFERFDFKYKDVYIDFKHWRYSTHNEKYMLNKIMNKLMEVNGRKALIINLFDDVSIHTIVESERIIQIPALLENDGRYANQEAIHKIKMILEE